MKGLGQGTEPRTTRSPSTCRYRGDQGPGHTALGTSFGDRRLNEQIRMLLVVLRYTWVLSYHEHQRSTTPIDVRVSESRPFPPCGQVLSPSCQSSHASTEVP